MAGFSGLWTGVVQPLNRAQTLSTRSTLRCGVPLLIFLNIDKVLPYLLSMECAPTESDNVSTYWTMADCVGTCPQLITLNCQFINTFMGEIENEWQNTEL